MAGAGYKLFNTGDVLTAAQVNTYLQEQVVMVFADATARTTALSGVLAEGMLSYLKDTDAVQYYNGSAWTTINTDQTPLTTKGDLFTYSTADARLAVGYNGDTLLADSSTTTGLRWNPSQAAGRNAFLNGAMDIWQRGTSISVSASTTAYTADRWGVYCSASNALTISRQATNDTTNLPFIQYCMRFQRNAGQTGTGGLNIVQSMETINSIPYAGKTVTLSFYARAGANYSATSNALSIFLISGTGTDQNRNGAAYTGEANVINNQTATLTTTWQRFSFTGTVGATATELAFYSNYNPTGTAGANDYFEITGIQLEVGSVATPFSRNASTLAGELAACMRYYWNIAEGNLSPIPGSPVSQSTAQVSLFIGIPVPMRTTPTIDQTTGTGYYTYAEAGVAKTFSSWSLDSVSTRAAHIYNNSLTGLTAGRAGYSYGSNASARLALSAEL